MTATAPRSRVSRWWHSRTTVIVPWAAQAIAVVVVWCYAVSRGVAYLPGVAPDELPGALDNLTERTGVTIWGIAWLVASAVCIWGLLKRRPQFTGGVAVMAFAWGLSYAVSWGFTIAAELPGIVDAAPAVSAWDTVVALLAASRDYLNAGSYLCPALLIALWIVSAQSPQDPDRRRGATTPRTT